MEKSCGGCTMCCKLYEITELNKPVDKWCHLVQIGVGCGDYEHRPQSCRDFKCLWLQSKEMEDDLRPDKIKAVLDMTGDQTRIVVRLDKATPDHYRNNPTLWALICHIRKEMDVIIISGSSRKLLPSKENAANWIE